MEQGGRSSESAPPFGQGPHLLTSHTVHSSPAQARCRVTRSDHPETDHKNCCPRRVESLSHGNKCSFALVRVIVAAWSIVGMGATALLAMGSPASAAPAPVCSGGAVDTCTVTFSTPGVGQNWVVPTGVTSESFTLYGATGALTDGDGARVTGTLSLAGGTSVTVDVGGAGSGGTGGANGGGNAFFGGGGGAVRATSRSPVPTSWWRAVAAAEASAPPTKYAEHPPPRRPERVAMPTRRGTTERASPFRLSSRLPSTAVAAGAPELPLVAPLGPEGPSVHRPPLTSAAGPTPIFPGGSGAAGTSGQGGGGNGSGGGGGGGGFFGGGQGGGGAFDTANNGGASGGGWGGSSFGITGSNFAGSDTGNDGSVNAGDGQVVITYIVGAATTPPTTPTTTPGGGTASTTGGATGTTTPVLAVTGLDVLPLLVVGIGLIAGGVALVGVTSRRQRGECSGALASALVGSEAHRTRTSVPGPLVASSVQLMTSHS